MKNLLIGLLALGSISSYASIEMNGPLDTEMFTKEVNENKSYYETLGEMFQSGSKPETSKLIGVLWSGRCFIKNEPFKPVNGGYHFKRKKNQDVGPLGDDVFFYEAASIWKRSKAPNYYDDKDISEVVLAYSRVFDFENSIAINQNNHLLKLRFSGKYLIEEISAYKSDVGPLGECYQTWARCYYFIPEYTR